MLKRLVVPALSLALLASSAHAEAPIRAEQQVAAWKRSPAQLKGLSITPWGNAAVWRDRSLRTPSTVADMKTVKDYLTAKQQVTKERAEFELRSGLVVSSRGALRSGEDGVPLRSVVKGKNIRAAEVVDEIHDAAETLRAEKQVAGWKKSPAQLKGLSVTPWGNIAVWRDRSLRTPSAVADMKLVKRYLKAQHTLTGDFAELRLRSGLIVSSHGAIRTGFGAEPPPVDVLNLRAADVVNEIHKAAEAIRAGRDAR